jgi:alkylation response protein AidB-like acyl-CoA dehydrogenase
VGVSHRPAYADTRVQRIYGGTNEIMKELIGRTL